MNFDLTFLICNYAVLPAWLLLIFAPDAKWTERLIHAFWVPLILAALYLLVMISGAADAPEGAGFFSLSGVMLLFTQPGAALAGWLHYLAFDLFVGAWEVRDARRRNISHLLVIPCLLFTLMMGPVGLGLYALVRWVRTKNLSLDEARALPTN